VHNDQLYLQGGLNDLGVATASLFHTLMTRQQVDRACALVSAAACGTTSVVAGAEGTEQASEGSATSVGIAPSSAAAQLQLQWQELEADLPYNKSRATVMQQGQIRCYQLGSATLGRSINEDDVEKGAWTAQLHRAH
jgi:hypothetical protein